VFATIYRLSFVGADDPAAFVTTVLLGSLARELSATLTEGDGVRQLKVES